MAPNSSPPSVTVNRTAPSVVIVNRGPLATQYGTPQEPLQLNSIPEEDVSQSVSEYLRSFDIDPSAYNISIYIEAFKRGLSGVPVQDIDHTHVNWRANFLLLGLQHIPGYLDFALDQSPIPLRVSRGAVAVIYNQINAGSQALLLGLADGSGERIPVDSRGFPFRLACLCLEKPSFAKALLGLERSDLDAMRRNPTDQVFSDLENRVRNATNIFTLENLPEVTRSAFEQLMRDSSQMSEAQWAVVKTELELPGNSRTKGYARAQLAGKTPVAEASARFGHVDDKLKVGEIVSRPEFDSKAVVLQVADGANEYASPFATGADIQASLMKGSLTDQSRRVLKGMEELAALKKGEGTASIVQLPETQALPNDQYNPDGDVVVMHLPVPDYHRQYVQSRGDSKSLMYRALLDGARPSGAGESLSYMAQKGAFSLAEMGIAPLLSKAINREEIDWNEFAPDLGIYGGTAMFLGGTLGDLRFYRGVGGNLLTMTAASMLIQAKDGKGINVVSPLESGALFSATHWVANRAIVRPVVRNLGLRYALAREAGESSFASLAGIKIFSASTALLVSTIFMAVSDWWSRKDYIKTVQNTDTETLHNVFETFSKYSQFASKISVDESQKKPISSEDRSILENLFHDFEKSFTDKDVTASITAKDSLDIEGRHFLEAAQIYGQRREAFSAEKEKYAASLIGQGLPVNENWIKDRVDQQYGPTCSLAQSVQASLDKVDQAESNLEVRTQQTIVHNQKDLQVLADKYIPLLAGEKVPQNTLEELDKMEGYQQSYLMTELLGNQRVRQKDLIATMERIDADEVTRKQAEALQEASTKKKEKKEKKDRKSK